MSDWSDTGTRRSTLAVAGFLAGLATWLLVDALPDRTDNARLILVLAVAAAGLFGTFLATAGPLKPWPASLAALGLALLTSLSMLATSFHFDDVDDYFETGHPIAALFILLTIPQPFFLAGLKPGGRFLSYPNLFEEAWELVVRVSAALVFVGAVWLIIYLSDLLFGLVGLDIIEDLLEIDSVPFLITGLALGVALAAAFELREVMGPDLAIRLIRLLLPIVLVVTAVFLVALPFRGLSGLFGDLSAASTLMAMTVTSATLVTSAVDRRDETAARAPILIISARILAALVSALGVLAVIAVALRVQQYGWTPNRLAAMTGALIFHLLEINHRLPAGPLQRIC